MIDLIGQRLGGYIIENRIGGGSMGEVYLALADDQAVAIKVLHPEYAQDNAFRARFEREMRLLKGLNHPHIVPLLDYGSDDDHIYFVMQYIDGPTLDRLMRMRRFSPIAAWNIIRPLVAALEYGHRQGVLHRDVKPSNVIIQRQEHELTVYLMDFGLAKRQGIDTTLTETGVSIGTPEFMSPEAAMGYNIDHRTDVYSLTILTYELLLGVLPFDRGESHLTAIAQVREAPPLPSEQHPDFPSALEQVLMQSLAKNPDDRHQSVREFAEAYFDAVNSLTDEQQHTEYWVV